MRGLAFLFLLAALIGGPARTQIVVLRSAGPVSAQLPAGARIAKDARLSLATGDRLLLLDDRGTRLVVGPGSFTMNGLAPRVGVMKLVRTYIAQTNVTHRQRGAVNRRGGLDKTAAPKAGGDVQPGLWLIDAEAEGNVCVPGNQNPQLWRSTSFIAKQVSIMRMDGGTERLVTFDEGESVADWPAAERVADGVAYIVAPAAAGSVAHEIRLHRVAADLPPDQLASALLARRCDRQFALLAAQAEEYTAKER